MDWGERFGKVWTCRSRSAHCGMNGIGGRAALLAGCEAFLTNDRTLKRVSELRILLLDELEAAAPPPVLPPGTRWS